MNGRTFSPNPRRRGKSHHHHLWQLKESILIKWQQWRSFVSFDLSNSEMSLKHRTGAWGRKEKWGCGWEWVEIRRVWEDKKFTPATPLHAPLSPPQCFWFSPLGVPTGSPSRGGDVAVYVKDINQPSLPTPFYTVLVSISVFWPPIQLYLIP